MRRTNTTTKQGVQYERRVRLYLSTVFLAQRISSLSACSINVGGGYSLEIQPELSLPEISPFSVEGDILDTRKFSKSLFLISETLVHPLVALRSLSTVPPYDPHFRNLFIEEFQNCGRIPFFASSTQQTSFRISTSLIIWKRLYRRRLHPFSVLCIVGYVTPLRKLLGKNFFGSRGEGVLG